MLAEDRVATHMLAADYRVADPQEWWVKVRGDREALGQLGVRRLLVRQALDDPTRLFVTIGFHHREPVDEVLRSGVLLEWFDAAGVEEIPPIFAGVALETFALDSAGMTRAVPKEVLAYPAGVIVAAVAPVHDVESLVDQIHGDADEFRASGVHRVWLYQALDDPQEMMILQEVDTKQHAARWLREGDALRQWVRGVGVGVYPPVFVGRLVHVFEPARDRG
ncbi:hypothetical protein [Geodermatophilus sp. URMC 63]